MCVVWVRVFFFKQKLFFSRKRQAFCTKVQRWASLFVLFSSFRGVWQIFGVRHNSVWWQTHIKTTTFNALSSFTDLDICYFLTNNRVQSALRTCNNNNKSCVDNSSSSNTTSTFLTRTERGLLKLKQKYFFFFSQTDFLFLALASLK